VDVRLQQRLEKCGVVAVLVVDRVDDAVPLARALLDGGIDAMELTLRTPQALPALRAIRQAVPQMLAGIGTVLNAQQVAEIRESGAAFGVAPGTNAAVIREARRVGLPFAPGVVTPSDIEAALDLGCRTLKFFPAEPSGGLSYLKNMAAPYLHLGVRFIPLGGLRADNVATYLADPLVVAVGGSWLAPQDLIQQQNWPEITRRAQQARQIADRTRSGATA
jgi:2-dehydro-3-deoxyphosphogluconate aldolase/(4S)-4-hydroxy-2-oxoglutarate aldolase